MNRREFLKYAGIATLLVAMPKAATATYFGADDKDCNTCGKISLSSKCAKKFNLGREIGTPLFCMGGHYIMG